MSQVTLTGHANATSVTSRLIKLAVLDCSQLVEIAVSIRPPNTPLSGTYNPPAKAATVRILATEFQTLTNDVANGGQVFVNLVYESTTNAVVAFSWQRVARASTAPNSEVNTTATGDAASKVETGS
jgi:hypothetical protein